MTEDAQRRRRNRKTIWLALLVVAALLIAFLVPPLVSISRYKNRITQLMAVSLGRPVRLSSVELRLLPRPGFVLTDLTVAEDPAYGAEPLLHANTVTADIRLLSLWRGKMEISTISVDEASLNLVRTQDGRWNLDPIFRNAAAQSGTTGGTGVQGGTPLPYLEATNSRINIKKGLEKLPFSLLDADVSFWQDSPGDWRVRLRGQPARTDVSLDLADTGIVRLEARLHHAPELRQMPIHLDMEWREAQLGQLSRLILGSDPGWRGDLTAELHLDGTAAAAQVKTRLRATSVHRAEFAPADTLDFDANCGFVYHYSGRSLEGLTCDSPLGNGHIRVAGDLPEDGQPKLTVELQRISAQAGLDALRTMRSGLPDGLQAKGTVTGKLAYDGQNAEPTVQKPEPRHARPGSLRGAKTAPAVQSALTGGLAVEGFELSGGGLSRPIQIPRFSLEPAPAAAGTPQAIATSVNLPAGAPSPLAVTLRFAVSGYQVGVHGAASLPRMRELAHVAGIADTGLLDALAGDPATLDLNAEGPWLPVQENAFGHAAAPGPAVPATAAPLPPDNGADRLTGTIVFRNANWKGDVLASPVLVSQATLHLGGNELRWDPVAFVYGPLKGTASVQVPLACETDESCPPHLDVHFSELDAAILQSALLGARKPDTLLSTLLARISPSQGTLWPRLEATLAADSLILGPVTLHSADAAVQVLPTQANLTHLNAALLGGQVHISGTIADPEKPVYTLAGDFEKVSPPALCQLLALRCSGGLVHGSGKLTLAGFSASDLSASAKGTLHYEWNRGDVRGHAGAGSSPLPAALARFDLWTGDAAIANGEIKLAQNQVQQGTRKAAVDASIPLATPLKVVFAASGQAVAAR